ncbi:MAG: anti-sigma factor, partial [Burkholderiaceae bacterium]
MNILRNEELADKLAAEYVLGTLRGHARRRFEHWLGESESLRRRVADWERRLQPMGELSVAVPPPASVWNAVERRIGAVDAAIAAPAATATPAKSATERKRNFWLGLREDLAFWRGLGMVSTAAALVLVSVLLARQADVAPTPALSVAMLANDQAQPVAVVT